MGQHLLKKRIVPGLESTRASQFDGQRWESCKGPWNESIHTSALTNLSSTNHSSSKKRQNQLTDLPVQFLQICQRKDASSARIKRNKKTSQIKFKVRCRRLLYTLVLHDNEKADKLKKALPPSTSFFPLPAPFSSLPLLRFPLSLREIPMRNLLTKCF